MYTVVPKKYWKHKTTGQRVSIHGAVPYSGDADKDEWEVVEDGWTVYNDITGTYGAYSLKDDSTEAQAQAVADRLNNFHKKD